MLSRDVFKKEVGKLVVEFGDKGFTMPKEKAEQWYERLEEFENEIFKRAIEDVLNDCSFAPSMADVVKRIHAHNSDFQKVKPVHIIGRMG